MKQKGTGAFLSFGLVWFSFPSKQWYTLCFFLIFWAAIGNVFQLIEVLEIYRIFIHVKYQDKPEKHCL